MTSPGMASLPTSAVGCCPGFCGGRKCSVHPRRKRLTERLADVKTQKKEEEEEEKKKKKKPKANTTTTDSLCRENKIKLQKKRKKTTTKNPDFSTSVT